MTQLKNWKILTSGPDWEGWKYYPEIEHRIRHAQKHLLISVYALTNNPLIPEIMDAIKRGINTEIYICSDLEVNKNLIKLQFSYLSQKYASFRFYPLKSENFLHTKLFVIDYEYVTLGSANLTIAGLFSNYELGISFTNSLCASELIEKIHQLRKYAEK